MYFAIQTSIPHVRDTCTRRSVRALIACIQCQPSTKNVLCTSVCRCLLAVSVNMTYQRFTKATTSEILYRPPLKVSVEQQTCYRSLLYSKISKTSQEHNRCLSDMRSAGLPPLILSDNVDVWIIRPHFFSLVLTYSRMSDQTSEGYARRSWRFVPFKALWQRGHGQRCLPRQFDETPVTQIR